MSVETNSHNYTNMNLILSQFLPARIQKRLAECFVKYSSYRSCTPFGLSTSSKGLVKVSHTFSPQKIVLPKLRPHFVPPRLCEAVAGLIHLSSFRSKKVRAKCIITAPKQNLWV